jgi:hypothetical protein
LFQKKIILLMSYTRHLVALPKALYTYVCHDR